MREKPIKKGRNSIDEAIPIKQTDHARSFDKKEYNDKMPETLLHFNIRQKRGDHPTQKPVALLEYLIKTYTLEGQTVMDNCMGSGSTGVACINTNRNFIGIEKDGKYFEIAQNRILNKEEKK
jgi:site-specific DNA-methyltransferase (adenine-specific)